MVWINLLFLLSTLALAKPLPKFLTKHAMDSLRFISADGRYAYVKKRAGVLGLVSSFRSIDFISESSASDFIMTATTARQRLIIEVIPFAHQENNLIKYNKILVIDWGNSLTKEMGNGVDAKLHLQDEWITFYRPIEKTISVKNVVTQRAYEIKLSPKTNTFFRPQVEMVNSDTVVYSDINDKGIAALIQHNLTSRKATVIYKSPQNATHLELCQAAGYMAVGEFPFEGVSRGSSISLIKLTGGSNLAGMSNIYKSPEQDIGNMVCLDKNIYFVKTMKQDKNVFSKVTEAVELELATGKLEVKTNLQAVSQLLLMDGKVLVPMRGEFFVLEGQSNLSSDVLKNLPAGNSEELPFDL